ncbi:MULTISPECIES: DUF6768 family protein [Kordiimonas]|jgi:protein-S-isoprenylcysteine O-methyltransferase Ste14|uniref:Uncharacterized protein n=1 Tax=Kordiimonas lacus TaxID=637679 RepID=A0A1G7B0I7_9PROT|nr:MULTISPECIES: DUF6768 family protein [Kordiimonas]SDE20531.1 hypothetical protein SAMN04488071_2302 [Kordiimonas lacus]
MTSIDERIKAELEREGAELDAMITDDSMPAMIAMAYKGSMRRWMWLVSTVTILLGVVSVWLLIEFSGASGVEDKLIWGVWAILAVIVMLAFEMWAWMQVGRVAMKRDIQQLQLDMREMMTKRD